LGTGVSEAIAVNRAPVLTLWAAVVAERLGFERDEALTLGRAVAGLNAQTKARRLRLVKAASPEARRAKKSARASDQVELLGRHVPVLHTPHGLRAAREGHPDSPDTVRRYLESRFGEDLESARGAMRELAEAFTPAELAEQAYPLYEAFRPSIPAGKQGWGARGVLELERIRGLAPLTGRAGRRKPAARK
jgi:hypothetical protein